MGVVPPGLTGTDMMLFLSSVAIVGGEEALFFPLGHDHHARVVSRLARGSTGVCSAPLEWGKFREGFDGLTAEMNTKKQEYYYFWRNINDELTVTNDERTKQMEILATTLLSINADTEELNDTYEQKRA